MPAATSSLKLFDFIMNWRARRVARELSNLIESGESVLDFGAGTMLIAQALKRLKSISVQGVDVADYHKAGIPLTLYYGKKMPFKKNSFDIVMANFVLHHCADPNAALDECIRVARKKLIIIEDVYHALLEKWLLCIDDWVANKIECPSVSVPFHFKTAEQWQELFEQRGLRIVSRTRIYPLPLHPIRSVTYLLEKRSNV